MEQLFAYFFFFLIGAMIGVGASLSWGMHLAKKNKKAKNLLVEEIKKKAIEMDQKTNSIKERLIRASQIAQTQNELRAQAEFPSKNGLHSKHKNGIIVEINELEQEKISILKTIIADGFNPIITVSNDGGKEEMPLSDYISSAEQGVSATAGKKSETETPVAPTTGTNEPRKIGKFFVYKGGKDDGTSH